LTVRERRKTADVLLDSAYYYVEKPEFGADWQVRAHVQLIQK
jgi:hypothetical protein